MGDSSSAEFNQATQVPLSQIEERWDIRRAGEEDAQAAKWEGRPSHVVRSNESNRGSVKKRLAAIAISLGVLFGAHQAGITKPAEDAISGAINTPSQVDGESSPGVEVQTIEQTIKTSRLIAQSSAPDFVTKGTLILDMSQLPGLRNGDYVNNDPSSKQFNLIDKHKIKKINDISYDAADPDKQVFVIQNPMGTIGSNNDGTGSTSPYYELSVVTDESETPKILYVSYTSNTEPAVRFEKNTPHETFDVKDITSEGIMGTSPISGKTESFSYPHLSHTQRIPPAKIVGK